MTRFLLISAIAMGILLGLYYLLLQREKMHRFNRFYLLASLVFSLAVPFITIRIYKEVPDTILQPATTSQKALQPQEAVQKFMPRAAQEASNNIMAHNINYKLALLWGIYGLGFLFFAPRFALNISKLYRTARLNEKIALPGHILVLLDECPVPYTFMQYIFVSKHDYYNRSIEKELLAHESTHVRQRHTFDVLFVETVKTLLWFNPFLYAYKNAIQLNHEFLADENTLNQFNNIPTYQKMLLDKATPHSNHLLASSINFSITKKRFLMMTKTTSATKGIVLKITMLPAAAALLYFLSTETVLYAKSVNSATKTVLYTTTPVGEILPEAMPAEEEAPEFAVSLTNSDTLATDARRDEYFKGVRIVIKDDQRDVYVDAPYEKLSAEHKRFYLNDIPEKKEAKPVSKEDYDFNLNHDPKNSVYYVDEKKVTREEVLKYRREDFVKAGFKAQGTKNPGEEMKQQFQMFLFTRPYFEQHLQHINDHYPDSVYTVNVTLQPVDTDRELLKQGADGKTALQREAEEQKARLEADRYNYAAELSESQKFVSAQFPGGNDEFDAYVNNKLKLPAAYKDKKISVLYSINTDGSLSEISCSDVDKETEKQIIRIFLSSPKWIPAQKNGKALKVNTTYSLKNKQ